ncbi:MAG TPA: CHAT domain-containing protein [Thiotrichaceae bacterium]|nr:CHAT domain-containing protein [Thiotrichaceae bacterium]
MYNLFLRGSLAQKIQAQLTEPSTRLTQITYQALFKAQKLANHLDNATTKAYSYGYLGHLYEQRQRYGEALYLTRQALFFTQQTRQTFWLNYLWQWQLGRILKAQHDYREALSAYQRAMDNFQEVRTLRVTTGYVNLMEIDFRQKTAPIYFELADLLLQQASVASIASSREKLLRQARATIERFREAELQHYLQTECLNFNTQCFDSETSLDTQTALLYPIPLPDRLELLLQRRDALIQVTVPVTEKILRETINAFLSSLHNHPNAEELAKTRSQRIAAGKAPDMESCTPALRGRKPQKITVSSQGFWEPAQTLYRWLIKPTLPHLRDIKTLVIVPDGALRSVPFAAFHDGERFLIERLALATLPNLCFKTLSVLPSESETILLSGLSKAVQGFSDLPCTEYELDILQTLYDEAPQPLLNETFTLLRLQTHFKQSDYSIVHIASHGQFSADLENTFVLTYDDKLNRDKLEGLISLTQLESKQPLELLTLSACETAVGDERAALGLAGVALKAGARSVLASLWRVDDEATPAVIIEFYRQLQTSVLTKAQALQNAQKRVLNDKAYQRYRHPYYWAAFLLIGNWF